MYRRNSHSITNGRLCSEVEIDVPFKPSQEAYLSATSAEVSRLVRGLALFWTRKGTPFRHAKIWSHSADAIICGEFLSGYTTTVLAFRHDGGLTPDYYCRPVPWVQLIARSLQINQTLGIARAAYLSQLSGLHVYRSSDPLGSKIHSNTQPKS